MILITYYNYAPSPDLQNPSAGGQKVMILITSCRSASLAFPVPVFHVQLLEPVPQAREAHAKK